MSGRGNYWYGRRRRRDPVIAPVPEPWPWVRAEGPVPEDVWGASARLHSGGGKVEGCCTEHVLKHPSGGLYLQVATVMGSWMFFPTLEIS